MKEKTAYVTTFCNFAHNLKTGRPIGHECYILPPKALAQERSGHIAAAICTINKLGKGPIVTGRARKGGGL
jgi:hypothetical protein